MFCKFGRSVLFLVAMLSVPISGCVTTDPMMRNIISGGAGVASAVLCYNVAGKGNGRYVSAAACGAGGYFGAKWLLDSSDQKEVDRVQSEYQRILSSNHVTTQYINSNGKDGAAQIQLTPRQFESFDQGRAQCRNFSERIILNGRDRGTNERRACRNYANNDFSEWRMQE